jgi:phosphoribosylaminoimidazole (AIR) synthetase
MFNVFNMGTGMAAVVGQCDADAACALFKEGGVDTRIIGVVEKGDHEVVL